MDLVDMGVFEEGGTPSPHKGQKDTKQEKEKGSCRAKGGNTLLERGERKRRGANPTTSCQASIAAFLLLQKCVKFVVVASVFCRPFLFILPREKVPS